MSIETLGLDDAQSLVSAAKAKAVQLGKPVSIAVLDASGNLIMQVRMDGALLGSIKLAVNKAFNGLAVDTAMPASEIDGIQGAHGNRAVSLEGGVPLHRNGETVGAIAVSGAQKPEDEAIVKAALATLCSQ